MTETEWCGPWRTAGPTAGIDDIFVEDCNGNVVARMGRDATPETKRARQNLIAASPKLYAALAEARDVICGAGLVEDFPVWVIDLIDAALAEARGESPDAK